MDIMASTTGVRSPRLTSGSASFFASLLFVLDGGFTGFAKHGGNGVLAGFGFTLDLLERCFGPGRQGVFASLDVGKNAHTDYVRDALAFQGRNNAQWARRSSSRRIGIVFIDGSSWRDDQSAS